MHLNSCCDRLWNASTEARRDPCQAPCAVVNRALGLLGLNPQRALWAALPWAEFLRRIVGGASVFPNATMRSVEENKCNAHRRSHGNHQRLRLEPAVCVSRSPSGVPE
jgi:hypothetical protein